MRRKSKRSIVKSFSYPQSKDEVVERLEEIARREGLFFSDIIVDLMDEFVARNTKSPQKEITMFQKGIEATTPCIFDTESAWKQFYSQVMTPQEYKNLDMKINIIISLHNKKLQVLTT